MNTTGTRIRVSNWWDHAACKVEDFTTFYVKEGRIRQRQIAYEAAKRAKAKEICARCTVRDDCLSAAYAEDDTRSIRGGMTPRERREARDGLA